MITSTQHMWGSDEMGWHALGLMVPILFFILALSILTAVYWVFRGLSSGWRETGPEPSDRFKSAPTQAHASALVILAERFARGEIDKVQYEDMRRALAN